MVSQPSSEVPQGGVPVAPPPILHEDVPSPRAGHVWIPGCWDWSNGHHVWITGHWMAARHGCHWCRHRWIVRDGRWHLEPGAWVVDDHADAVERERSASE